MKGRITLGLAATFAAALAAIVPAVSAAATSGCPSQQTSTPFTGFGDKNSYYLLPGASFETAKPAGWTLSGATQVAGNESYLVNAKTDKYSLRLPAAASATSPFLCVDASNPTIRFFLRATGASTAKLNVDVLIKDSTGKVQSFTVKSATATTSWAPSPEILYFANYAALLSATGTVNVAFRFTAVGTGADFTIDDVYIDPRKSF